MWHNALCANFKCIIMCKHMIYCSVMLVACKLAYSGVTCYSTVTHTYMAMELRRFDYQVCVWILTVMEGFSLSILQITVFILFSKLYSSFSKYLCTRKRFQASLSESEQCIIILSYSILPPRTIADVFVEEMS